MGLMAAGVLQEKGETFSALEFCPCRDTGCITQLVVIMITIDGKE
jgi:Na+/H+ antiporter NhaD/arsenite permease-like protein